jgi:hypothetical protein
VPVTAHQVGAAGTSVPELALAGRQRRPARSLAEQRWPRVLLRGRDARGGCWPPASAAARGSPATRGCERARFGA